MAWSSTQELLDSIHPGMELTKMFFITILSYDMSFPGFAEIALTKLEEAGCSLARKYYTVIVTEYNFNHEKDMKNVAAWFLNQPSVKRKPIERGDDNDWKRQREAELLKRKKELLLMKKSQKWTGSLQS